MNHFFQDPIIIMIIILILAIPLMIIASYFIYKNISKKTDLLFSELSNRSSEIIIDIKRKRVYFKTISLFGNVSQKNYELDDFIYMISLNPDSKKFREFLKLINNESKKIEIENKAKTIVDIIPFVLSFNDGGKCIAMAKIENINFAKNTVKIRMNEWIITPEKKEEPLNYFKESLKENEFNEIFITFNKEIKTFKTKGLNLIKIYPKYPLLYSNKEYDLNKIQLTRLKIFIEKEGYKSMISKDGSLYFISPSLRKTNYNAVYKEWMNKLSSLFPLKNKEKKNSINLRFNAFSIAIAVENKKDSRALRNAFSQIKMLSSASKEEALNKKIILNVNERIKQININASDLIKKIKSDTAPILRIENLIETRGYKSLVEFAYDIPLDDVNDIINYSFRYKKELLEFLINYANDESKKYKDKLITVIIRAVDIPLITDILIKIERADNFYISISETPFIISPANINNELKKFHESGHKIINLINDVEEGSLDLIRLFNPSYIVLTSRIFNKFDPDQTLTINLKKIELIKSKSTKIINLK